MKRHGVALIQAAIILITLIVTAGLAQAQSAAQITITVKDQTGAAVPNASITLNRANESKSFTADSKGVAQVSDLSSGEWTLSAKGEGFAGRERPLIHQGIPQEITVILEVAPLKQSVLVEAPEEIPSAVQLNASAKGGSYLDVPVRELPYNFSVITQEYMQERGITNMLDALELVSGVTTWADFGYIPAVDIRGQSTTDAGIFIANEGIVSNSVPQSGRNMDSFALESVEVLKGPASFSYGSGTSGAAINTRAKSPKREFRTQSIFNYGSFGYTREGFDITGPLTKSLSGRIVLNNSRGGTNLQRSNSTNRGVTPSVTWTPLERVTITARGAYLTDHLSPYFFTPLLNRKVDPNVDYIEVAANTFVDPRLRTLNYNMTDPRNDTITRRGTLTSEVDLSHGWKLQHRLYANSYKLDSINNENLTFNETTLLVSTGGYNFNFKKDWLVGNTVTLRNTLRFWGRSVSFTVGGTAERNNQNRYAADTATYGSTGTAPPMDYLNPIPNAPLHQHFAKSSRVETDYDTGFFEGSFRILQKLALSGGVRLDHITNSRLTFSTNTRSTVTFHPVTGRYALIYDLTPTVTLYVGNSKAVQPAGSGNNSTGATALVNLNTTQAQFTTQPSRGWEGGMKASAWRERIQGTLSYFQMRKYNLLTQDVIDGTTFVQRIGKIKSEGIDTQFMVSPIRMFSLQGDFVWNNGRYLVFNTVANGVEVDRSGNRLPRTPAVQWQLAPIVKVGPVTGSISFRTRGASWSDANNTQRLPPLTVLNSNISINMTKGFRVTLTGRNLSDEIFFNGNRNGITANTTAARFGLPRNYSIQITQDF